MGQILGHVRRSKFLNKQKEQFLNGIACLISEGDCGSIGASASVYVGAAPGGVSSGLDGCGGPLFGGHKARGPTSPYARPFPSPPPPPASFPLPPPHPLPFHPYPRPFEFPPR